MAILAILAFVLRAFQMTFSTKAIFFSTTRGPKSNEEWRQNIPINLGLEHFHKLDLSVWSLKPSVWGRACISVNVRQTERKASELDPKY